MKFAVPLALVLALAACKDTTPATGGLVLVPVPEVALATLEPPLRARLEACVAAVRAAPGDAAAWGQLGMVYDAHDLGSVTSVLRSSRRPRRAGLTSRERSSTSRTKRARLRSSTLPRRAVANIRRSSCGAGSASYKRARSMPRVRI